MPDLVPVVTLSEFVERRLLMKGIIRATLAISQFAQSDFRIL